MNCLLLLKVLLVANSIAAANLQSIICSKASSFQDSGRA